MHSTQYIKWGQTIPPFTNQEFFGSHKSYIKSNLTQFVFFENLVLYVTKGCYQKSFYWKSLVEARDFKTMLAFYVPFLTPTNEWSTFEYCEQN